MKNKLFAIPFYFFLLFTQKVFIFFDIAHISAKFGKGIAFSYDLCYNEYTHIKMEIKR